MATFTFHFLIVSETSVEVSEGTGQAGVNDLPRGFRLDSSVCRVEDEQQSAQRSLPYKLPSLSAHVRITTKHQAKVDNTCIPTPPFSSFLTASHFIIGCLFLRTNVRRKTVGFALKPLVGAEQHRIVQASSIVGDHSHKNIPRRIQCGEFPEVSMG